MFSDDRDDIALQPRQPKTTPNRSVRAFVSAPDTTPGAMAPSAAPRRREARDMAQEINPALMMFQGATKAAREQDLDSPSVREIHGRLMSHFLSELDIQAGSRAEMALDEAFYDSHQWDEEDARILRERGQEPMVLNVVSQSINWLIGSQKRARTDFRILPRRKSALMAAQTKTQILKYLSDVNKSPYSESDAFSEAVKAGVSWLESGIQDDTDGEPIYDRHESWRNIICDSTTRERDANDARYIFRPKWIDVDHAASMFPNRAAQIEMAVDSWDNSQYGDTVFGDDAMDSVEQYRDAVAGRPDPGAPDFARRRVRLIEAWFKVPEEADIIAGGDFRGEVFDPYSRGHIMEIATGRATVRRRPIFRVYVMVMTNKDALWFGPSPYRHNRYPFTPLYAYRDSATGAPYGYIRNMRDPQRDINKRLAKALYIISSNKVIMDEGAVSDLDEFMEENARPDGVLVKKPGKFLELNIERGMEQSHLEVMQISMQSIQTVSGITDEAMGRTTNAVSGKAIGLRQDQGMLASGMVFDNLRATKQYHGEKLLSLVEQFMPDEKEMRITDARGDPEFIVVNDGLPENDIVATKADFIISEDAWSATVREAQVAQLFDLMNSLAPVAPQIVMAILDVLVESMDVPSRDLIVKRIRAITGQEDPNVDPNTPDPERDAREQMKAFQQQLEMRAAMANLAKLEGDAAKSKAGAEKAAADAAKVIATLPGENLESKRKALELALAMLSSPPSATITADHLLDQVGLGDAKPPMPGGQAGQGAMMPQQQPAMPGPALQQQPSPV